MRCDDVADVLAAAEGGADALDRATRRHVGQCLRCQAELVQYRRLLRALHALRTEVLEPAPGLLADILASVEEAGERHAVRSLLGGRRAAYLGAWPPPPPPARREPSSSPPAPAAPAFPSPAEPVATPETIIPDGPLLLSVRP